MAYPHFDSALTPLQPGINLIEASAGTGKTYAIAMLVLRFVVEQAVPIENILVVTFTKAATEELKSRIRARLVEAKLAAAGQSDRVDGSLALWLASVQLDAELIRQRLELALLSMDLAAIYTIHGLCQRTLKDYALETGQLFDAELSADVAAIKQACADDFWRAQLYLRPAEEVALLTSVFNTPAALLASLSGIPKWADVVPQCPSIDEHLRQIKSLADASYRPLMAMVEKLREALLAGSFKPSYGSDFENMLTGLTTWLLHDRMQVPEISVFNGFTLSGIKAALNGTKFKSTKTETGDARKTAYLSSLNLDTTCLDALAKAICELRLVFRTALLAVLDEDLDKRMQQLNLWSFDDLINRLADALRGDDAKSLCAQMQQRYPVALIDEFQDTDQNQWFIFNTLFSAAKVYLYLIGDPKQAIYKFRGADIYSYLLAQQQAQHHFTLEKNWRSHPDLVLAVNALFQKEQAFLLDGLLFTPVKPALSTEQGALQHNTEPVAPLVFWQLPPNADNKMGYWSATKAADEIRVAVINEIVQLLSGGYKIADADIKPQDIAILVRSNGQAREYQQALRVAAVPAVLNSVQSVFASQEAFDFYVLLQAIAHPGDVSLLKQALSLDWFGLDGQALYQLSLAEEVLDNWLLKFLNYYQRWQKSGLMAMMRYLLVQEKITLQFAKTLLAERQLTNLQHLIELVQQAAIDEHLSLIKTLDWLHSAITADAGKGSEERQLRLESDENAVKIITMHRAKGLEYAVVFCPYLWQCRTYTRSEKNLLVCHDQGQMVADLGSADFERHRELALAEELAEDIRVFYVAVTRAKYRCYLVWADVRTESEANNSAMAWLLDLADTDFIGQQIKLARFSKALVLAVEYQMLTLSVTVKRYIQAGEQQGNFKARKQKRSLFSHWQMSSYTALAALSLHESPELPEDKAGENVGLDSAVPLAEQLPKGVQTGNVVHELLEKCAFAELALGKLPQTQREQALLRYGLKLETPALLDQLLQRVVSTPLSAETPGFCLMNLEPRCCLKEMPFYLSLVPINVAKINQLLMGTPAFQALNDKSMSGYLTGFIDLICEFQGKYYVIDYKTNSLMDYSKPGLTQAMREHNYGLQYWLYALVLHQYLQQRLADYAFEQHFGGVRYLFVRGMSPSQTMLGVYDDVPDLQRLDALALLFGGV
ncbi:MAG: exodeoxyribonuclease V subunit beta [Methylococcaceae bacterium]|jgi:exodeoxyribonuclease V beta subunit